MSTELVDNAPDGSLLVGVDDRLAEPPLVQRRRTRRRLPPEFARLLGPVLLLGAWFAVTATGLVDSRTLSSPQQVFEAAAQLVEQGSLQDNLLTSLRRAMTGLALGVAIGALLAVLSGLFRTAEYVLDANLQMLRSMPILALVPLAILWFGIGEEVKILLVTLGVMFPIYLNTHAAIRGVEAKFFDLAATLGLGRLQTVRRIVIPGALPGFFTGLRFSVAIAWLVLVVSEQINASSGIGYLMTAARGLGQTDVIMVGLLVYALLGLISDALVRTLERRALSWRSTSLR